MTFRGEGNGTTCNGRVLAPKSEDEEINGDEDEDGGKAEHEVKASIATGVGGEVVREQITNGRGAEVGVVNEISSVSQQANEGETEGATC